MLRLSKLIKTKRSVAQRSAAQTSLTLLTFLTLMIDIRYIRNHSDQIIENCRHRHVDVDIPKLLEIDEQTRQMKSFSS